MTITIGTAAAAMRLVWFVIASAALASNVASSTSTWPSIRAITRSYTFIAKESPSDYPVELPIRTTQNVPAYRLECHSGDYEGEYVVYFSGTFHCGLFAVLGDRVTSGNLLADDTKAEQSSDWFNRGRMIGGQLLGACGEYPEYGRIRHFRLRGMLLTLAFTDLEWYDRQGSQNPRLQQFTVTVTIAPDATANSATSARTKAPRPPKSCVW